MASSSMSKLIISSVIIGLSFAAGAYIFQRLTDDQGALGGPMLVTAEDTDEEILTETYSFPIIPLQ